MNWAEFRRWAWEVYGYPMPYDSSRTSARYAMWNVVPGKRGVLGSGTGIEAEYGVIQRRRFAAWLRCRTLIEHPKIGKWLDQAEDYADGWLVNDGSGIRWIEHPELEAHDLVSKGFVAIKCGL